jgi:hypothetical protein
MMCGNVYVDLTKVKISAFIILRSVAYMYLLTKAGMNEVHSY